MRTKTLTPLLLIVLIFALLIPAQSAENISMPANNTQEQFTTEEAIETMFLIGIILSPVSFLLSVVALWLAWKNRRKVYTVN